MTTAMTEPAPRLDPARLKAARRKCGLRQEDVAARLGYSRHAVTAYELGYRTPPSNVLITMAAIYGVTVEQLCVREVGGCDR